MTCSREPYLAGNSGGPVTDTTGTVGIGTITACYDIFDEPIRPGYASTFVGMTPLEPALAALGAQLKTG